MHFQQVFSIEKIMICLGFEVRKEGDIFFFLTKKKMKRGCGVHKKKKNKKKEKKK